MKKKYELIVIIVVIALTSLVIGVFLGQKILNANPEQDIHSEEFAVEEEYEHNISVAQLSKIALKNIGAEVKEIQPQQYYLTKDVSGMVVKAKWATISVTSSLSGIIREVFVREGYGVKPGENLASFEVTDERILELLLNLIDYESQIKLTKTRQDALVDERTASIELELLSLKQENENISTQLSFKDATESSLAGEIQIGLTEAQKEMNDDEAEKATIISEIKRLKDAGDAIAQQEILKNEYRLKELNVKLNNLKTQIESLKNQISAARFLLEQRQEQISEIISLLERQKSAILLSFKVELESIEIQRKSVIRQLKILNFPMDLIHEVIVENDNAKHIKPIIYIKAPEKSPTGKEFVIEDRLVNTGQYVEAGSEVFKLSDLWELWVRAEV
ncbi:MAG: hypothetical protein K8S87_10505, partial [Planctomycetes bacterium]|nr:hypothetical protein [Planctomycetota bacterium]